MIDWGISANSHNAALAVFKNKELVFASEAERFSKVKNDPNLNFELINYALQYGAPDIIYWYENPYLKTARQLIAGQGLLLQENNIKRYLAKFNLNCNIKYTTHHKSHAAAGFYTSPFNNACVIVIDAIGEFDTLTIWKAKGSTLKKVFSLRYPNSIGLWYSAMTQRCGLKPNEEEYILMGMSVFGDPDVLYNDIVSDFIDIKKLKVKQNLHKGCLWWKTDLKTTKDKMNIAAATQKVYEDFFVSVLRRAIALTNNTNLVLMGGCALNCVANPLAYKFFKRVWIMPAPGDNGSAIGAVLSHYKNKINWPGPNLGYDIQPKIPNHKIVTYLVKNKICGVARGKAEFGPRALGSRSLIADPRGKNIKQLVNSIKHREQFRPFAPIILQEHAHRFFEIHENKTSPYMQFIYKCKYPERFPAIVHVDGTSRVQTVPADGSDIRQLLDEWYDATGCPMLLNTSLNIKGEPIINDEKDVARWYKKYNIKIFS